MTNVELKELVHLLMMCGIMDKTALDSGNITDEEWLRMNRLIDKYQAEKTEPEVQGDLISREALKKALIDAHINKTLTFDIATFNCVMNAIDNAPTVDVEQIKSELNPTVTSWYDFDRGYEKGYEKGQKERPQGKWIPVKTRELTEEEKEEYPDCTFIYDCKLPEDGEEVLVTTWNGKVALDTFYRDEGCYFETYCDEEEVVAWQPLPEPYKKGGAE